MTDTGPVLTRPGLGLEGRRVVVAGAGAGGLGEAVVALLLAHGATVAGLDIDEARLQGTIDTHRNRGTIVGRVTDVTDPDALATTLDSVEADLGPIDGLVHVVGGNHRQWWHPFEQFPLHELDDSMRINLRSAIVAAQVVGGRLRARGQGSIVFVSSISSFEGMSFAAPYAMAKAAINSLVQTLALEFGSAGVRVNAVAPGTIMTVQSPDGEDATTRDAVPLQRRGRPEDIAAPIVFLLSPLANFITGQVLAVDGGCMARPSYVDRDGLPVFIKSEEFRAGLLAKRAALG